MATNAKTQILTGRIGILSVGAANPPGFNGLLGNMVNFASMRRWRERKSCPAVCRETGDTMMLFGFFQVNPAKPEDDIATGTYADGAVGTPLADPSAPPRDRSQAFRRTHPDRDYGLSRKAGQSGAGMVA